METKSVISAIGVDECGRGSLIGDVVAGAIFWEPQYSYRGLNDSKQLSLKQREYFFSSFERTKLIFAIGSASIEEIDAHNIFNATRLAMQRAIFEVLHKLRSKYVSFPNPEIVLVDGKLYNQNQIINIPLNQKWIIKGDEKEPSIMAASIVAKVLRDRNIKNLVEKYPEYEKYGWRTNIGYGTKKHIEAIKKFGITPFHRKTFEPIKTWLKEGII